MNAYICVFIIAHVSTHASMHTNMHRTHKYNKKETAKCVKLYLAGGKRNVIWDEFMFIISVIIITLFPKRH